MLPGIPGQPVSPEHIASLQERVGWLCNLDGRRFPGSQPVSFATSHLDKLEQQDFWVCEKSDGIRVLLFICLADGGHDVFLIDRKNNYRIQNQGFYFPHYEDKQKPMRDCILDGELVLDKDHSGNETLRYLVFDCLVIDEKNVMEKPLSSRYGRLEQFFFRPYKNMLSKFPEMARNAPFQLQLKPMQLAYYLQIVLDGIPKLQHGTDGFIYTAVNSPYIPRTDEGILKWKPPEENSVDFKLMLRFPERPGTGQPDFFAKPLFLLYVWEGGDKYAFYDHLTVDDSEWDKMKKSKVQYDDRVVEARWDFPRKAWRLMRLRDDKAHGNHTDVVENVVQTILHPVHKADLLSRCPIIRTKWKEREGASGATQSIPRRGPPPPPYNHPVPSLPFPGAPHWQGASIGYGFAKVTGPTIVDGWHR